MFKRVIWFAAGATAGVVAARKAERVVQERMDRYSPPALANSLGSAAKEGVSGVRAAVRDGRREMQQVSSELEAAHDPSRRRQRTAISPAPQPHR